MRSAYIRMMDALERACVVVAGLCLVAITLIIPWGVFTRYVLNAAASWPEPLAVLLMIWFTFMSAAVCYRENLHIGVAILPNALSGSARIALGVLLELLMMATNLFLLVWGIRLVHTTFHQSIAEFPIVSVGVSYLPLPIGGAIVILFVIERLWTGAFFEAPRDDSLSRTSSE